MSTQYSGHCISSPHFDQWLTRISPLLPALLTDLGREGVAANAELAPVGGDVGCCTRRRWTGLPIVEPGSLSSERLAGGLSKLVWSGYDELWMALTFDLNRALGAEGGGLCSSYSGMGRGKPQNRGLWLAAALAADGAGFCASYSDLGRREP